MSDETVPTYATRGLRLWAEFNGKHGHKCPCLICGDTREYLGMAARVPQIAPTPAGRQERAS